MNFWGMLLIFTALFAGLVIVVCREKWKKYYIVVKTGNSLAILCILSAAVILSGEVCQFRLMLPAFLCCFAGDILLAFYNRGRRKIHFLLGLGIFLAGHICFVRWLCRRQRLMLTDFIFPLAAVLLVWGLTSMKAIHTGRLRPFILIYAFFVALFFSKGVGVLAAENSLANGMTALGGTLFLISDISILFLYFYKTRGVGIHIFNLATYYYGMFFLATNLLFLS